MTMNPVEFQHACISAIDSFVANGGEVTFESYGSFSESEEVVELEDNCGCALSILANGKPFPKGHSWENITEDYLIELVLGLSGNECISFIHGFDQTSDEAPPNQTWYDVGCAVRHHVMTNHPKACR